MSGYMGKILRINLTSESVSTIDTKDYEQWGGGHGIGSAIFWDLCTDKTVSGFDPKNVVTIMTSPLSGTLAPAVSGRTEVQGIGVQGYPIEWFTRSNFGGRFAAMLKYAGWDGIVLEGKADKPVWIDIRNQDVAIKEARGLWGMDTWETQEEVWREVMNGAPDREDWWQLGTGRDTGRTTQKPAVLTIGPAGENLCRNASLVHDAGNGAGQGGFGGVWGSKNLKAISVVGTGSVAIADPNGLMKARLWAKENYALDMNNLYEERGNLGLYSFPTAPGNSLCTYPDGVSSRPQGCFGCHKVCRRRTSAGGNESHCVDFFFYDTHDRERHDGKQTKPFLKAVDLAQRAGINVYELESGTIWIKHLYKLGLIGRGKEIDTDLPVEDIGEYNFAADLIDKIVYRKGIGDDLAEGLARAAKKWGRLEEDLKSGILPLQYWGYSHHYDARVETDWGYGSILGERDINEHDFNWLVYWTPSLGYLSGDKPLVSAEELSKIIAEKCKPYCDPLMVDYSDEGIYSEHMVKLIAWHRHYTRFWKQSIGYCDWAYADFVNPYGPNYRGLTGEGEPKFLNTVTGNNLSFEDGIEIGRKIWNLDRAVWIIQGRHRDLEKFAQYTYEVPANTGYTTYEVPYVMPTYEDGTWDYRVIGGRVLDEQKFEEWKSKFYEFEGWDPASGWPRRSTLEKMGMGNVADELAKHGKLGA